MCTLSHKNTTRQYKSKMRAVKDYVTADFHSHAFIQILLQQRKQPTSQMLSQVYVDLGGPVSRTKGAQRARNSQFVCTTACRAWKVETARSEIKNECTCVVCIHLTKVQGVCSCFWSHREVKVFLSECQDDLLKGKAYLPPR